MIYLGSAHRPSLTSTRLFCSQRFNHSGTITIPYNSSLRLFQRSSKISKTTRSTSNQMTTNRPGFTKRCPRGWIPESKPATARWRRDSHIVCNRGRINRWWLLRLLPNLTGLRYKRSNNKSCRVKWEKRVIETGTGTKKVIFLKTEILLPHAKMTSFQRNQSPDLNFQTHHAPSVRLKDSEKWQTARRKSSPETEFARSRSKRAFSI